MVLIAIEITGEITSMIFLRETKKKRTRFVCMGAFAALDGPFGWVGDVSDSLPVAITYNNKNARPPTYIIFPHFI